MATMAMVSFLSMGIPTQCRVHGAWILTTSRKRLRNSNHAIRSMVSFHGHATRLSPRYSNNKNNNHQSTTSNDSRVMNRKSRGVHRVLDDAPPPDPNQFLTEEQQEAEVQKLYDWYMDDHKQEILCITGAGLSTESGIADYRGHQGSYYKGHKPMVHDHFMQSEYQRKRYWGRGMVGWTPFASAQPNAGHFALTALEQKGKLGVTVPHSPELDQEEPSPTSSTTVSVITQNVDALHSRAGTRHVIELHGRSERVKCMNCGATRDRADLHLEMETFNEEWLRDARAELDRTALRPDGDAAVQESDYNEIVVPSCHSCGVGFYKPDIVFFGDVRIWSLLFDGISTLFSFSVSTRVPDQPCLFFLCSPAHFAPYRHDVIFWCTVGSLGSCRYLSCGH